MDWLRLQEEQVVERETPQQRLLMVGEEQAEHCAYVEEQREE